MNLKMWLRGTLLLTLLLLLSTTLSACWPFPDSPSNPSLSTDSAQSTAQANCLGYVAGQLSNGASTDPKDYQQFFEDLFKHDEHLGVPDVHLMNNTKSRDSGGPGDCSQAFQDLLNQSSQQTISNLPISQLNNEQVSAAQYPQNIPYKTLSYTYNSQLFNNCAGSSSETLSVSYGIPVVLVLGSLDNNNALQPVVTYVEQLPSNSTSNAYILFPQNGQPFLAFNNPAKIAQYLYYNRDLPRYFNHSESVSLTIPPHSTAQLQLPLTIDYQAGWGMVTRNGVADLVLSWYYTFDFHDNFDPNNLNPYTSVSQCG